MASQHGLLFVTMQPHQGLSAAQFDDWYNNEHGPTRLRLPYFRNGFRYRVKDGTEPQYLALYEVTDVEELGKESYTRLRTTEVKSAREKETMAMITIDRRIYDRVVLREKQPMPAKSAGAALVGAAFKIKPEHEEEYLKWFEQEHISLVAKTPGWQRSRLHKTSKLDAEHDAEYLSLHDFENEHGIGGPEFQAAHSTPWFQKIKAQLQTLRGPWIWEQFYIFDQGPRDLLALGSGPTPSFVSNDGRTKTYPSTDHPAIESFITTSDGANIPYRLEGATSPDAPVVVLVNSILVEWGIWDDLVAAMGDQKGRYRILRYNTRGRNSEVGSKPVTLGVLVSDLLELLDALNIPAVATAVGVSLGGATVLNAAIDHPDRVPAFIACDTNANAPASNPKAWGERIEVAEKEGAASADGRRVVGESLAEVTVRRWFVKASCDGGNMEQTVERVKSMVRTNDLEGFRASVKALYQYDLKDRLASATAKGTFVVGDGDGVLPKTMKEMAEQYGGGAKLEVISGAGHLPMVEKPQDVASVILQSLEA